MADNEQHGRYRSSPPVGSGWDHIYPHSTHGTPAQEYSGFNFSPEMPMEPSFSSSSIPQRPLPPQLQPLIMPAWPSMLNNSSHSTFQLMFAQPVQPIQPMLPTPVSATSMRSTPTPRKTLTDLDPKRMCQYAKEHPNAKQTEIGGIFDVERRYQRLSNENSDSES
ncbi:hypothetical protein LTR49_017587 [Elasticomyces elasticus]|nr:hypothetical protein LTR49_017587 [Elasticomyces elasticus]